MQQFCWTKTSGLEGVEDEFCDPFPFPSPGWPSITQADEKSSKDLTLDQVATDLTLGNPSDKWGARGDVFGSKDAYI